MKISLIAALDENRLIGSDRGIPWHLPRDIQHFRSFTTDKAMLLGRRTFEEMSGWFTTQRPIVLSRERDYSPQGAVLAAGVREAVALAIANEEEYLVVAGGAQIYELALPVADELLITEVHAKFSGNAYFPAILPEDWQETSRERFEVDGENAHPMSFVRYRRH